VVVEIRRILIEDDDHFRSIEALPGIARSTRYPQSKFVA
jgi:hypothetical protein